MDYYDDQRDYVSMKPLDITLPEDVLENIADRAATMLANRMGDRAQEVLREKINVLWEQVLREELQSMASKFIIDWVTQPRSETNIWGERTGKDAKTFSERILEEWQNYMKELVNSSGESPQYNQGRMSRAQWLVKQLATDQVNAAVKEAISEIGAEARERTKEAVSAFIAQQLAPRVDGKLLKQS